MLKSADALDRSLLSPMTGSDVPTPDPAPPPPPARRGGPVPPRAAEGLPRRLSRRREDLQHAGGRASHAGRRSRRGRRHCRDPRSGRNRPSARRAWMCCPARNVEYRGTRLEEFDLDAAIARLRGFAPGGRAGPHQRTRSRHAKRWQDVDELLKRGNQRLYHAQRTAHREPERRRSPDHRRAGTGNPARLGAGAGR